MKVHKMFCIDVEIGERLKDFNGSQLVNDLLQTHFSSSKESIDKKREELNKEMEILDRETKELELVERETEKAKELRLKKESILNKRKIQYDEEKSLLSNKVKNKEISFEEFLNLSQKLKRKWGL